MPRRLCLSCKRPFRAPRGSGGTCPSCKVGKERERLEKRTRLEPWRYIYNTSEWRKARRRVLDRDRWRCTYVKRGVRCSVTHERERMHVDHSPSLRERWAQGYRGRELLAIATDPEYLRTRCALHNRD